MQCGNKRTIGYIRVACKYRRREVISELDDFIIAAHDFNIVHGCAIEYDFPKFDCEKNDV